MNNLHTHTYIDANILTDLKKLLLAKRTDSTIDYAFAFRQIAGFQRIRYKIPTFYANRNIRFPVQLSIEQCSSESTALYKSSMCEGELFVDLTGGFGVDFAFISPNFKKAIYVERNEELCDIAKHNFVELGLHHAEIACIDSVHFIETLPMCDCVLVDPARRDKAGSKMVLIEDCEPNIANVYKPILQKTKMLLVKFSPMLDISLAIKSLQYVSEVHIISVLNECKEVLLILRPDYRAPINFFAINIRNNQKTESYHFRKEQEFEAKATLSSEILKFLYEPNSSILKAGAFKMISTDFSINKLHTNTHLYTSNNYLPHFPGRIFKVNTTWKTGTKELSELKKQIPKANLSTRNYPLTTEQLKKKIGLTDGGDIYLFACTLTDGSKVIIECVKASLSI